MKVSAGSHTIEFKFEPEVVKTGSQIALGSNILLGLVILGGIGLSFRRKKSEKE
ncbi:MAG: LPXTG cell wall anchor domain-containing protein [Bacteroidota bacterium]